MAPSTPNPKSHSGSADTTKAVDEFMSNLDHPCKAELQEIRETILGADPAIAEGIKWKAPSFRTTDYFATTNLREKSGLGLILHLGAKVRDTGPDGLPIRDPEGLLKWLAKDRATIVFKDMNDVTNKKGALVSLIRQWVAYV
jgi:hypothetical protein